MVDSKIQDSILLATKKSLGLEPEITDFDSDIIMCINTALNILTQLGIGPNDGFTVVSEEETWDDFLGKDKRLNMAKTYVFMKTRIIFDGQGMGNALLTAYQEQCKELEVRLNYQVDPIHAFDRDNVDDS